MERYRDIVIVGGGVGGVAAALAAADMGYSVLMSEPTQWIGGQLTSQAVPPDENPWIESFGGTWRYRQFREKVRAYYRRNYRLSPDAQGVRYFNPGNATVSRLCHEPRVALAVLHEMLAPHLHSGRLQILLGHRPVRADVDQDRVRAVELEPMSGAGDPVVVAGRFFLDASELGDLLPLTGTEYVTGAESQAETGELHAPHDADPLNMQSITMVFALDYRPGEDHTIDRPAAYAFWRDYQPQVTPAWPGPLFSWTHPIPTRLVPRTRTLFGPEDEPRPVDPSHNALWPYRRIIDRTNFAADIYPSDISLVNWPQNDYLLGPIYEVSETDAARHLQAARELSLSFLYWMQTEAPRPNGGLGYPGLRLRSDVMGSDDGLALYPYVREARRIRARFTVTEAHVGQAMRPKPYASPFSDSVGIGYYNIDLHPSTAGDNYIDVPSWPFQIPLGALIPVRMENLLPAAKNLGTTHITNGCYRLHPVEWNIGEAVGALVGYCLRHRLVPSAVLESPDHLARYQALLDASGIERAWPTIGARED